MFWQPVALGRQALQFIIAPRPERSKIRNPNIEIRNKLKDLNPNYEIRNGFVWNFSIFDHLKLFRISDFESLEFVILFILGALCAFA
jgi:hypothetical protein